MKDFFYQFKDNSTETVDSLSLSQKFSVTDLIVIYYNRFAPQFVFKRGNEKHNFFEFYYVVEGEMQIMVDNIISVASAGDYFLVPPMHVHSMLPNKCYCTGISISFSGENLPETLLHGKLSDNEKKIVSLLLYTYAKNCDSAEFRLSTLFDKEEESVKDVAYDHLLKSLIESLIILLLQAEQNETREKSRHTHPNSALAKEIKNYLDAHYKENVSLEVLAKKMDYSIPHVCRVFKKTYNETIINYLSKKKIDEALVLIERGEMPLREISDELGFDSISYFNKIFKKFTGMSPGQYKKTAQAHHLLNTYMINGKL